MRSVDIMEWIRKRIVHSMMLMISLKGHLVTSPGALKVEVTSLYLKCTKTQMLKCTMLSSQISI